MQGDSKNNSGTLKTTNDMCLNLSPHLSWCLGQVQRLWGTLASGYDTPVTVPQLEGQVKNTVRVSNHTGYNILVAGRPVPGALDLQADCVVPSSGKPVNVTDYVITEGGKDLLLLELSSSQDQSVMSCPHAVAVERTTKQTLVFNGLSVVVNVSKHTRRRDVSLHSKVKLVNNTPVTMHIGGTHMLPGTADGSPGMLHLPLEDLSAAELVVVPLVSSCMCPTASQLHGGADLIRTVAQASWTPANLALPLSLLPHASDTPFLMMCAPSTSAQSPYSPAAMSLKSSSSLSTINPASPLQTPSQSYQAFPSCPSLGSLSPTASHNTSTCDARAVAGATDESNRLSSSAPIPAAQRSGQTQANMCDTTAFSVCNASSDGVKPPMMTPVSSCETLPKDKGTPPPADAYGSSRLSCSAAPSAVTEALSPVHSVDSADSEFLDDLRARAKAVKEHKVLGDVFVCRMSAVSICIFCCRKDHLWGGPAEQARARVPSQVRLQLWLLLPRCLVSMTAPGFHSSRQKLCFFLLQAT